MEAKPHSERAIGEIQRRMMALKVQIDQKSKEATLTLGKISANKTNIKKHETNTTRLEKSISDCIKSNEYNNRKI